MSNPAREAHVAEEAFMVLHSGEIPEVALHSSLYYLQEDPAGPGLVLHDDDILPLKQAVVQRYMAIISRDLAPENRDKGFYRGLARCAVNWQRLVKFCTRENLDFAAAKAETAAALLAFLHREIDDVQKGSRSSSINCPAAAVEDLAAALSLSSGDLPAGWRELCRHVS